jgi:hypothetical protein
LSECFEFGKLVEIYIKVHTATKFVGSLCGGRTWEIVHLDVLNRRSLLALCQWQKMRADLTETGKTAARIPVTTSYIFFHRSTNYTFFKGSFKILIPLIIQAENNLIGQVDCRLEPNYTVNFCHSCVLNYQQLCKFIYKHNLINTCKYWATACLASRQSGKI